MCYGLVWSEQEQQQHRLNPCPTPLNTADVGAMRAGCSAGQVLSLAGGDKASADTQELALKLLSGETLDEEEAYRLGKRIFDVQQPSTVLW